MRKYRIAELYNQYSIEVDDGGDKWVDAYMLMPRVPKFFDSLADARSWVATIKRGVVYHDVEAPRVYNDAEDAPNLAQDERKAEGGTSGVIKRLLWFDERIGLEVMNQHKDKILVKSDEHAKHLYNLERKGLYQYSDPR
jgi:hypothetical protein